MRPLWHDTRSAPCRHRKVNSLSSMPLIRVIDDLIGQLIKEAKPIPAGLLSGSRVLPARNGHFQKSYEVKGEAGNEFVIKLRQALVNPANFSVILGYRLPGSYSIFRLRRYNSKHPHTNILEDERLHDFHIHMATERYQRARGFEAAARSARLDRILSISSTFATLY